MAAHARATAELAEKSNRAVLAACAACRFVRLLFDAGIALANVPITTLFVGRTFDTCRVGSDGSIIGGEIRPRASAGRE